MHANTKEKQAQRIRSLRSQNARLKRRNAVLEQWTPPSCQDAYKRGVADGVRAAAQLAGTYDQVCTHAYPLEQTILNKFNLLKGRLIKKSTRSLPEKLIRQLDTRLNELLRERRGRSSK